MAIETIAQAGVFSRDAVDKINSNFTSLGATTAGGTLTSAHLLVGSSGNVATDTEVTGDVTIDNAGATTIKTSVSLTTPVLIAGTVTTSLVPTTNDAAALGNTTHQFSDLFLAEGGVINWDNGDATLTQVSNMVTLAGADITVPNIVSSGDVKGATFHAGSTAGVTAGPFATIASINVIAGIVTTLTGSA